MTKPKRKVTTLPLASVLYAVPACREFGALERLVFSRWIFFHGKSHQDDIAAGRVYRAYKMAETTPIHRDLISLLKKGLIQKNFLCSDLFYWRRTRKGDNEVLRYGWEPKDGRWPQVFGKMSL